ncbi:MAG: tRNA (adenosine(37)-N6)-threonylcarbamoyltransferase complex ATPase subunit type 1 TsaE [bacterium]|nr:tRNA (adenosine(37)-N6)-threonylcarbamoyltransferase complex ATPase subunit type 1 TsaE [bacterium]
MRHSGSKALTLTVRGPEETEAVAAALGAVARAGDYLALEGDLGAGKTLFTSAFAAALGVDPVEVDSPSYVLLNEYAGRLPIYHFDAYRLEGNSEELSELGFFDERLDEGIVLVEWANRVERFLPAHALRVRIEISGEEQRRLHVNEPDERVRAALARFRED